MKKKVQLQGIVAQMPWNCRNQQTVAMSTTELEYTSLANDATQEALWLKQSQEELSTSFKGVPILVFCDNQSAIRLASSNSFHFRGKYMSIDVYFHFNKRNDSSRQN